MKKIWIVLGMSVILALQMNFKDSKEEVKEEMKAVFISYMELREQLKNQEVSVSKKHIREMIDNIKSLKLNTIILQVRYAGDAIYPSKLFPPSDCLTPENSSFDVLSYFLKEAHKKNMKLLAWINPYRIDTQEDLSKIGKDSIFYPFLNTDTLYVQNGVYLNPAKEEVTDLIVKGVKEVLTYPVDGILFDDYFYPSDDIDNQEYLEYQKTNKIDKKTFHLNNVSHMIKKVYKECQKKKIPFGVSPDGNIDNNYQKNYADVKRWMKEKGYIDFIMPQIYYGFYNSTKAYAKTIKEWSSYIENDIDLYIALAFYKVGRVDEYAQNGSYEWLENSNIIMREIILSRNLEHYQGFSLFRYDYIFEDDYYTENSLKELENMKKIIA